VLAGVVEP